MDETWRTLCIHESLTKNTQNMHIKNIIQNSYQYSYIFFVMYETLHVFDTKNT